MSSDQDAAFDAIVGELGDLADLDIAEVAAPETPVMDQLLEWHIADGQIVVTGATAEMQMFAQILRTGTFTGDTISRFDAPPGDLRADAMATHVTELNSEAERCVAAAGDLLSGGIPLAAAYDAARGFQQVRLRLLSAGGQPPREAEFFALVCAALSEDLLTLDLA